MSDLEARMDRAEQLLAETAVVISQTAAENRRREEQMAAESRRRDERIDALAQSVELLATMHRDSEKQMGRLDAAMADLSVTMNRLANIVIRHEERLDSLDGGDA